MNLKKKIVALGVVCVLAMGITTSAFAANVTTGTKRHIKNVSIQGTNNVYLNLEGEGQAYTNRNVTVYSWTSSADQYWYIEDRGNGLKVYSAQSSATGQDFALNVNRSNHNCNIYPDMSSNNSDSVVTTTGNDQGFIIDLASTPGYELQTVGRNVGWGGSYEQKWALS